MLRDRIIRAWKDPEYRASLSEEESAELPENPAGAIELTDEELDMAAGGSYGSWNRPSHGPSSRPSNSASSRPSQRQSGMSNSASYGSARPSQSQSYMRRSYSSRRPSQSNQSWRQRRSGSTSWR